MKPVARTSKQQRVPQKKIDPYAGIPGYEKLTPKQRRRLSATPAVWDFTTMASQRLWLAQRVSPALVRVIQVSAVLSVLAAVAAVAVVYNRPDPLTVISFPDGRMRCGPLSVDPQTGHPRPRSAYNQRLCAEFDPPPPALKPSFLEIPGLNGSAPLRSGTVIPPLAQSGLGASDPARSSGGE